MARNTRWFSVLQYSDVTLNASSKIFTVPAGKLWRVLSVYVKLTSTGTPGNRQQDVDFRDAADNVLSKAVAGTVQTASLTREYIFAPLNPQETAFTGGLMYRAIPVDLVLPAEFDIRVWDSAAIDAAADDTEVRILVEELTD